MKSIFRYAFVLALLTILPAFVLPEAAYSAPPKNDQIVADDDEEMEELDEMEEENEVPLTHSAEKLPIQSFAKEKANDKPKKEADEADEGDEGDEGDEEADEEGEMSDDEEEEETPKEDGAKLLEQITSALNSKRWSEAKGLAERYKTTPGYEDTIVNYAYAMGFMNAKKPDYSKALGYLGKAKKGRNKKYSKLASSAYTSCLIKAYWKLGFLMGAIVIGLIFGIKQKLKAKNAVENQEEQSVLPNQQDESSVLSNTINKPVEPAKPEIKPAPLARQPEVKPEPVQRPVPVPSAQIKPLVTETPAPVVPPAVVKPVEEIKPEEPSVEPSISPSVAQEPAVKETKEDFSSDYGTSYESPTEAAKRIEAELKLKRAQLAAAMPKVEEKQVEEAKEEPKAEYKEEIKESEPVETEKTEVLQNAVPNIPPFRPSFGNSEDDGARFYERKPVPKTAPVALKKEEIKEKIQEKDILENSKQQSGDWLGNTVFDKAEQIKEEKEKVAKLIQNKIENTVDSSLDAVWEKLSEKALKSYVEPKVGTTVLPTRVEFNETPVYEENTKTVEKTPVTFATEDLTLDLSEESMRDDLVGKLKMLAISDGELRELMSQRNPQHIPNLIEYIMTRPEPVRLAFVAREIGNYKDEEVVKILGKLTEHNDERVAVAAIQGLEKTGMLSAILILCSLVKTENPLIAQTARAALGNFGAVQLMKALETLPDQEDEKIKESGIFVLSRMKGAAVEDLLKRMLKDESEEVRCQAILAMSFQKNPVYIETLREFFRSASDKDKSLARKAIVYLQSFRA